MSGGIYCIAGLLALLATGAHARDFLRRYGTPPAREPSIPSQVWMDWARKLAAVLAGLAGLNTLVDGAVDYAATGCTVAERCDGCVDLFVAGAGLFMTSSALILLAGWRLDERRLVRWRHGEALRRWEAAFETLGERGLTYREAGRYFLLLDELMLLDRELADMEGRPSRVERSDVAEARHGAAAAWNAARPACLTDPVRGELRAAIDRYVAACRSDGDE